MLPTFASLMGHKSSLVDTCSASKNTDPSVFYTEIETKILNTDSDPKNTDRDPVIIIQQNTVTLR